ncbi:MAG: response regulator transcription factor [Lachnospiraceae bacterium]|nr:response regulator transcription factor [Lachnospiraceae bacterium]
MSYHIALCDDSAKDRQNIAALVKAWADSSGYSVVTEEFPSAEAFLFCYAQDKAFDILLLDIEMGGMDGVTLAKQIRQEDRNMQIVFITGYGDYIAEGYEVAALHYLMKPVHEDKLEQVMNRAVECLHREERTLTLKTAEGIVRLPFGRILYLEAARNYVAVHAEGFDDCVVRRKLGEFEDELDNRFFRVGRSYIVNLSKLYRITRTELKFPDGTVLPLPRGAYDTLNRAIIEHL